MLNNKKSPNNWNSKKGGGAEMAVGCNKFSFVLPGHIFGWNLMKLGMGPLFDMLYREKWSNSVRRTVRPAKPAIFPAIFFSCFFTFWIIWSRF